jgi:hypothetical protein
MGSGSCQFTLTPADDKCHHVSEILSYLVFITHPGTHRNLLRLMWILLNLTTHLSLATRKFTSVTKNLPPRWLTLVQVRLMQRLSPLTYLKCHIQKAAVFRWSFYELHRTNWLAKQNWRSFKTSCVRPQANILAVNDRACIFISLRFKIYIIMSASRTA